MNEHGFSVGQLVRINSESKSLFLQDYIGRPAIIVEKYKGIHGITLYRVLCDEKKLVVFSYDMKELRHE